MRCAISIAGVGVMGAVIGRDARSVYAVLVCDRRRCWTYVEVRPDGVGEWVVGLAQEAMDRALAEGWRLSGETWCPEHADPPRRHERLGDRVAWVWVQRQDLERA